MKLVQSQVEKDLRDVDMACVMLVGFPMIAEGVAKHLLTNNGENDNRENRTPTISLLKACSNDRISRI